MEAPLRMAQSQGLIVRPRQRQRPWKRSWNIHQRTWPGPVRGIRRIEAAQSFGKEEGLRGHHLETA